MAHGLCSAGLFALAGFMYAVFYSRSFILCKGVLRVFPGLSLVWFLFCVSNMAFPPRLSLLGEIYLIISLLCYCYWLIIPLGMIVFVTGAYSMVMYSSIQHGVLSSLVAEERIIMGSSFIVMCWVLWVPLNLLIGFRDVV